MCAESSFKLIYIYLKKIQKKNTEVHFFHSNTEDCLEKQSSIVGHYKSKRGSLSIYKALFDMLSFSDKVFLLHFLLLFLLIC